MKPNYEAVLTRFNISPTSAKVYVALLELGKSSADKIAKQVGTYKANVYEALDRLTEAGLATHVFEGKKRFFQATNPEKLISVAEEEKQINIGKYDELKKDIENIMPELSAKYQSVKDKDLFEVYKGRKGYKAVITEILRENPKMWEGFGNLQVQEFFPIEYKKWFKKVKFKLFATKSKKVLGLLTEARKTTKVEIKWLPQDLYMPIVWTVFGENVLIIIYEPETIVLRIKSRQVVETFSNQFNYLWDKHYNNEKHYKEMR